MASLYFLLEVTIYNFNVVVKVNLIYFLSVRRVFRIFFPKGMTRC